MPNKENLSFWSKLDPRRYFGKKGSCNATKEKERETTQSKSESRGNSESEGLRMTIKKNQVPIKQEIESKKRANKAANAVLKATDSGKPSHHPKRPQIKNPRSTNNLDEKTQKINKAGQKIPNISVSVGRENTEQQKRRIKPQAELDNKKETGKKKKSNRDDKFSLLMALNPVIGILYYVVQHHQKDQSNRKHKRTNHPPRKRSSGKSQP